MPIALALRLIKGGCGFKDYTEENVRDSAVRDMSRKIEEKYDKTMEIGGGRKPARVEVKLKNGTTYEARVDFAKGSPENPLTREELEEKFRNLATVVLSCERAEAIIKAVRDLDSMDDVSILGRMLVR
ncbi:MAG: hypothetical protein QME90_02400 [Thermodesulfobacteriota bacterium]|nr:hypothetical protein [Thermodesulfobacteriota bacterium]